MTMLSFYSFILIGQKKEEILNTVSFFWVRSRIAGKIGTSGLFLEKHLLKQAGRQQGCSEPVRVCEYAKSSRRVRDHKEVGEIWQVHEQSYMKCVDRGENKYSVDRKKISLFIVCLLRHCGDKKSFYMILISNQNALRWHSTEK